MIKEKKSTGRLRKTPQRMAILALLRDNTSHPSADEIYKSLQPRFPTMSLATVYNTLRLLRKDGRLKELRIDSSRMRFDPNTSPHHHIICLGCGKVVDFFSELNIEHKAAEASGFKIVGSEISFYGYCPECLQKEKDKAKER